MLDRLAAFTFRFPLLVWAVAVLVSIVVALATIGVIRHELEDETEEALNMEVQRRAIEIMGQTLNGKLMGAVSALGVIEADIKRVATGDLPAETPSIQALLEAIGVSYGCSGVFIVGRDGIIKTSWDNAGKSSSGLDVKFRAYFKMAMAGKENIYAAVSIITGKRALYFSAPIFSEINSRSEPVGAMAVRLELDAIDQILRNGPHPALLLTPQGVTFATNRSGWEFNLAGAVTPERLKAIRDVKQFGKMFDGQGMDSLPFDPGGSRVTLDGRRHAVARTAMAWNDPLGPWSVVLLQDLAGTLSGPWAIAIVLGMAGAPLLGCALLLAVLRDRFQRQQTALALERAADEAARRRDDMERVVILKNQVAGIITALQGHESHRSLAEALMAVLMPPMNALSAGLFLLDRGSGAYGLIAGYALPSGEPEAFREGEGLAGTAALTRKTIVCTDIPPDYLDMRGGARSGLIDCPPRTILSVPVIVRDQPRAVLEIALATPDFEGAPRTLLEEVLPYLTLNLEILDRFSSQQVVPQQAAPQQAAKDS